MHFPRPEQALQRVADKLLGCTSRDRRKLMRLVRGGAAPRADLCDDAAIDAQIAEWRREATRLAPAPGTAASSSGGTGTSRPAIGRTRPSRARPS